VVLPGGGMLATASGNTMSVWDILSGGRVLQTVCAHSKTITSLCADASGSHLLSASLDHMVKVYELRRYKVRPRGTAVHAPRCACRDSTATAHRAGGRIAQVRGAVAQRGAFAGVEPPCRGHVRQLAVRAPAGDGLAGGGRRRG
jgi:hypothetical protein